MLKKARKAKFRRKGSSRVPRKARKKGKPRKKDVEIRSLSKVKKTKLRSRKPKSASNKVMEQLFNETHP
ncbi:hypothetical protein Taro_034082 [Colocasia esculenta]|uniref:Uncharacterized protein n=1 Tax=Colocasia esculenta TaxID=4460 RepID=A0A843WEE9_COLES|nr:hypothetical protein [Colocasia esculenta]